MLLERTNAEKVLATFRVINNGEGNVNRLSDPPNEYHKHALIHIRGQMSKQFPKKSIALETWHFTNTSEGRIGSTDSVKLLGLPKEHTWVLYAPFNDKTLVRDAVVYNLTRQLGQYAPRTVFVELFLNNTPIEPYNAREGPAPMNNTLDYAGVYMLTEKIRRDQNRVDIKSLSESDVNGTDVTGGYIFKKDKVHHDEVVANLTTPSGTRFVIDYPSMSPDPWLWPAQKAYLLDYLTRFENVLAGNTTFEQLQQFIDVPSAIDYFLMTEFTKNVDGFRYSMYFHKDRNSTIAFGPQWDLNEAWGNANYAGGSAVEGWEYHNTLESGEGAVLPWYNQMLSVPQYRELTMSRWRELRQTVFSVDNVFSVIDDAVSVIGEDSVTRNFMRWPNLDQHIWPEPDLPNPPTYANFVAQMKQYIIGRGAWMDTYLDWLGQPASCGVPGRTITMNATVVDTTVGGIPVAALPKCPPSFSWMGNVLPGKWFTIPGDGAEWRVEVCAYSDVYHPTSMAVYSAPQDATGPQTVHTCSNWTCEIGQDYGVFDINRMDCQVLLRVYVRTIESRLYFINVSPFYYPWNTSPFNLSINHASPSPSPSRSPVSRTTTASVSLSQSPVSMTQTGTITPSPKSVSVTRSPSRTASPSRTPSHTPTPHSPSVTPSESETPSETPSLTLTPTSSSSPSVTPSVSITPSTSLSRTTTGSVSRTASISVTASVALPVDTVGEDSPAMQMVKRNIVYFAVGSALGIAAFAAIIAVLCWRRRRRRVAGHFAHVPLNEDDDLDGIDDDNMQLMEMSPGRSLDRLCKQSKSSSRSKDSDIGAI